jgi:Asp-tRNA(Asn)/Glu-tRNA(Gln) amidotransferase A subunit family amidase
MGVDVELAYLPAGELAAEVAGGRLSPVEVVANALARIEQVDPALNCFCVVTAEQALAAAREAEAAVARGDELGPLHGVPVALKDTTPTAGTRTTLGSYAFEHWVPDRDASIVGALQRAGAIVVGKTTSPEFAHTLFTDSPLWGPTRNPWDLTRSPGGSSGGSGAAVASGCVPLAEGSDMGGSVRIPAAWCGVVGLKPGLGRIPMDVLPGLFDSISHHGPLARCVDDARLFLAATQGPDDADIQSVTTPLDLSAPTPSSIDGLRLALSVDLGCWAVDPAIEDAVRSSAAALAAAGAVVEEVDLALTARDEEVWIELWGVFMAAYYGDLVAEHRDRMDPDVLRLIALGESLPAVRYKRLELERTDLWRRVAAVLADHDAIVCPTMATGPVAAAKADGPRLSGHVDDGRYHSHDMTAVWNLVPQCPAISVPCGFDDDGLPVGLQIVGRRWREDTVLRIGRAAELAMAGTRPRPPL